MEVSRPRQAPNSVEEHARVRALPGMTDALFDGIVARGHAAAFPRR